MIQTKVPIQNSQAPKGENSTQPSELSKSADKYSEQKKFADTEELRNNHTKDIRAKDKLCVCEEWVDVCAYDSLVPNRGLCALIDGEQVAIFRLSTEDLYAISNYDPFSKAFVISRGIVGSKDDKPKIASPIYKQTFDLQTGVCFEDESVKIPIFPIRNQNGRVQVSLT